MYGGGGGDEIDLLDDLEDDTCPSPGRRGGRPKVQSPKNKTKLSVLNY